MKNAISFITIVSLTVFTGAMVLAGNLAVTNTFVSGDPAIAADVNTNFTEVETEVNDNDSRISGNMTAIGNRVLKSGDTMTGTLVVPGIQFSSPAMGTIYASPNFCQRGASGVDPYLDTVVVNPDANTWGPSIATNNTANGTYSWLCPVHIQFPAAPAGFMPTFTLTGATLVGADESTVCLVKGDIRFKTVGTSSLGTSMSIVYSGANSTDYAFTNGNNVLNKAFPAFTQVITDTDIVFVLASIVNSGGGSQTCRYSGVLINYTVDMP